MNIETIIYANLVPSIVMIAMLVFLWLNPLFEPRERKLFITAFSLNLIMIFITVANYVLVSMSGEYIWIFRRATTCLNFLISPFIPFFLLMIFRREKIKWTYLIPAIINGIFCIASLFTRVIFFITENNKYQRGPLFFFSFVTVMIYIVAMIVIPTANHSQSRMRERAFLVGVAATLILCMYFEIAHAYYFLTWVATGLSLVLYYLLLMISHFTVDVLTGAYNRLVYTRRISSFKNKKATIAMIDLNDFKGINDNFGHDAGDKCLINVTQAFQKYLPRGSSFFRIGGDEFVVISKVVNIEAMRKSFDVIAQNITEVGFAYGMVVHDPQKDKIADTLKKIDILMYEHKKLLKCQLGEDE